MMDMSTSQKKKYANAGQEKIFPHKHCGTCNKIIPEYADGYCSAECRNRTMKKEKPNKKKIIRTLLIVGGAVGALLFVIFVVLPIV
jgi:predicted nucleic acid-binding Zn ribbon protein